MKIRTSSDYKKKQNLIFQLLIVYGLIQITIALLASPLSTTYDGLMRILRSPSNLICDYVQVGGIGAAFLNSGLLTLLSLFILRKYQYSFSPLTISTMMMLSGFSFFGKNILNSLPIIAGTMLYIKLTNSEDQENIVVGLLATCLSPIVSILFLQGSLTYQMCAVLTGGLIGIIIVPLFDFLKAHTKGLNLYNMGFSAGILGTVSNFLSKRTLNIQIIPHFSQTTHSKDLFIILIILFSIFLTSSLYVVIKTHTLEIKKGFLLCIQCNKMFTMQDVIKMIRFSVYGLLATFVVYILKVPINGPIVGTILTFAGFGMYSFKLIHYLSPALGVMLISQWVFGDLTSTNSIIILLFASTLSPYTLNNGLFAGFLAGGCYSAIARKTGVLHAGINLYNCGFAGGLTVLFLYTAAAGLKKIAIYRLVVRKINKCKLVVIRRVQKRKFKLKQSIGSKFIMVHLSEIEHREPLEE